MSISNQSKELKDRLLAILSRDKVPVGTRMIDVLDALTSVVVIYTVYEARYGSKEGAEYNLEVLIQNLYYHYTLMMANNTKLEGLEP